MRTSARMKRAAVAFVIALAFLPTANSEAADGTLETASSIGILTLVPGQTVRDFYELTSSADDATCGVFLKAINGEKTYDPNDERDLTLGIEFNYSWSIAIPSAGWASPPEGGWQDHRVSRDEWAQGFSWAEDLLVDLDNDGDVEHLYRFIQSLRSQNYVELFLFDQPTTVDEMRQKVRIPSPVMPVEVSRSILKPSYSDYYLIEVARIGGRNLLTAANMLRGQGHPVHAYVMTVDGRRGIDVVCRLESKFALAR